MNTFNGSLEVRIVEDRVYIQVDACDLPSRATAELTQDHVKTLRATLEEALILLEYPEQNTGLGNDTLEQP